MKASKQLIGMCISNLEKMWKQVNPGTLEWDNCPIINGWSFQGLIVDKCTSDMNMNAFIEAILHVKPGEPWESWAKNQ